MNYKRFDRYIIVDEELRPMSFQEDQLCYVGTERARRPVPVELYSYAEAKDAIKKTLEYRARNNFSLDEYILIPVKNQ